MIQPKINQIILKTISILYIILFVYTASSKLINIDQFYYQIEEFPFISRLGIWITWGIPIIEILIAGLFLFPKYVLTALYASFSLMSLFTVYIFIVLIFGDNIPCSCGGVISTMGWREHILFNCVFILFSLIGILLIKFRNKHLLNKNTT